MFLVCKEWQSLILKTSHLSAVQSFFIYLVHISMGYAPYLLKISSAVWKEFTLHGNGQTQQFSWVGNILPLPCIRFIGFHKYRPRFRVMNHTPKQYRIADYKDGYPYPIKVKSRIRILGAYPQTRIQVSKFCTVLKEVLICRNMQVLQSNHGRTR